MEGNYDGGQRPEEQKQQIKEFMDAHLEESRRKYDAAKLELEGENPGIVAKVDAYLEILKKGHESLTDDEKEKMDEMQADLKKEGENDPRVKNLITAGEAKTVFEISAEEPEKEEGEQKDDEDLKPSEAKEMEDQMKSVVEKQRELANKPGITQEEADDLHRDIRNIGEADLMKKIKSSRGVLAKTLYGVWVTFLISTAFFFLATKYVAKPFEGKH